MVNLKLVVDMNGLKDSRYNNIRLIFNESEHSYIDTLKRVLIDEYGWRIVDIEKQLEEGKIYIKTEV